jgi:hypothetical protein
MTVQASTAELIHVVESNRRVHNEPVTILCSVKRIIKFSLHHVSPTAAELKAYMELELYIHNIVYMYSHFHLSAVTYQVIRSVLLYGKYVIFVKFRFSQFSQDSLILDINSVQSVRSKSKFRSKIYKPSCVLEYNKTRTNQANVFSLLSSYWFLA